MGVRGQTRLKACFLTFDRKIDQNCVMFSLYRAECVSSEILPQIPVFKMGVRGQTRLKACFLGFGRKIDQKADVSDAVYI